MKTIAEIRLDNLEALIAQFGTQDKVAELADTSPVYLSQLRHKAADSKSGKLRQIGDPIARKLEAGCGKELGWMDNVHSEKERPTFLESDPAGEPFELPTFLRKGTSREVGAIVKLPLQGSWPFQSIEPSDFLKMSEFERGQVEGFIKGLLQSATHHRKSNGAQ